MILTFRMSPKLEGIDYVISIVYSPEKFKKLKIGMSWHGGRKPIIRRDSMISVLRTKQADVDFLISIEDYSELLNHLSKNGKSLCDKNIPIIS